MFIRLILLFSIVPFMELWLLIEIGHRIGVADTLALVILTGIAGAYLTKKEGFSVLQKIQAEMQMGRLPAESLFDGVLILAGGLLLLTPGIITDVIGFCTLLPFTRGIIKKIIKEKMSQKLDRDNWHNIV